MKPRRLIFLLVAMYAMAALFVSCQSRTTSPWPPIFEKEPAIATTVIEVEGDQKKGEKIRIQFNRKGECKEILIGENREPQSCDGIPVEQTFYCIAVDDGDGHNTMIYGRIKAYCGNVLELTDGADIQFKSDPAMKNRKCKKIGGDVICY